MIDACLGNEQPATRVELQQIPNIKQEAEAMERGQKQVLRLWVDQGRFCQYDTTQVIQAGECG